MPTIEDVNRQADGQPGKESQPSQNGQTGHQENTEEHTEHRGRDAARSAEPAVPAGIAIAQDDNSDRNQNKSEEGPDVGKVRKRANVQKSRRNANQKTGNPSSCRGRAK